MKRGLKDLGFYVIMIVIFGSLMYLIAKKGESHQTAIVDSSVYETSTDLNRGFDVFIEFLTEHIESPFGILLLQMIVILLCCRFFGWIFVLLRQPSVIGEILAGIILGPSILGYWFPGISAYIFPPDSLGNISLLSQFGLILFMFAIGMELDIEQVRKKMKETILISHASIIVPFFLGMLIAYFIYDHYAYPDTPFLPFALFIGIAMSITAFPVLARIIQEKGLTKTHLGSLTLASAANGDITAWCLLAVVIAVAQAGSIVSALYNILFLILYMLIMFLLIRPFFRMVGQVYHNEEVIDKRLVAFIFFILVLSSFLTEILGLHALFGAFMAGVIMPADIKFRKIMAEKVEGVSLSLFLPLFFVSTGLKTEIGLLNTPELWVLCGVFIVAAIIGKFGGATLSARFVGENWKNSFYIGTLMNTRGLMELVVLTIGYEMQILPPSIFVMLVLMTLVTTFMTTPTILFIQYCFRARDKMLELKKREKREAIFKVLISFGRAGNGQVMLDVAHQMFSKGNNQLDVTALHLTLGTDINPLQIDNFEAVSFKPVLDEAQNLNMKINTRYEVASNIEQEIFSVINEGEYDFLMVGAGINWSNLPNDIAANQYRDSLKSRYFKPESWFFPTELLKDKTRMFIEQANCAVGVFVNRNFNKANKILLLLDSEKDLYLLNYAKTLLKSTHGTLDIVNRSNMEDENAVEIKKQLNRFFDEVKSTKLLSEKDITGRLLSNYNFMFISYDSWNDVSENRKEALQLMPSTLILSK
jgi:Kef-type K+ transport system membrane component KefB